MSSLQPSMASDLSISRLNLLGSYVLLLALAVVLGSNFMMTKISVQALPPMFVVSFRLALASLILCMVMYLSGYRFPRGAVWLPLVGSAFFGHTLPFSLLAWGQQQVDAGLAAILMATMPLFTLFLAQIFTDDEKPNRYSIAGFTIALVGIVLLFGPEKLASLADQSLRQYAIVAGAMCYGINAIITKSLLGIPWQQTTAAFMIVAFVLSLPLLFVSDLSNLDVGWKIWATTIYTGVVPTALGAVMIVFIIRRTSASFLSQINFLVPIVGVGFAILFLGEVLPANAWLALAIILCGVALARHRPKRAIISINKGG